MLEVITGFAVIWVLVLAGYLVARYRLLGDYGSPTLTRLAFFVLAPALMVSTLATSSPGRIFTGALAAFVLSTLAVAGLHVALARLWWRRDVAELTVGALAAGYVNAGNLGIPIAAYILGDVSFIAPVLMFQVLLASPAALAVLDVATGEGRPSWRRLAALPLRNPLMIASVVGIAVMLSGVDPPAPVLEPFALLGGAAVPMTLLALGMSLRGSRPLRGGDGAAERWTAVLLKSVVQPLLAFLIGRFLFGLEGAMLLAAVVTSALPTAQNVYVFAARYGRGESFARDAVVLSTAVSAITLVAVAALLG
ncbi:AEC family transporter [Actinoplanes sp. NBRC 103695]|uniref:AEC family transporter n=1 Tax=Actinoplanes sp. NBRC 103695 TaxID=3032202 RepID=UPI0024A3B6FA|nr:AEC family transporter [Actinoplanes sp. NBRC 103695]GLY99395.1 membrane protein [Actinoplanes sp. NBRC 103695]